jgi:hypothetical protein
MTRRRACFIPIGPGAVFGLGRGAIARDVPNKRQLQFEICTTCLECGKKIKTGCGEGI